MAKTIRPAEFGPFLEQLQGTRSNSEFERETGIARQILHRLKNGYLPTPAVLDKLGMQMFYEMKPNGTPAGKRGGIQ